MRTRSFGTTDLRCSEIGFGTWALGSNWWGDVTSDEGVEPDPARARARDHVLRHRRRVREGRERGDRRPRARGRAARVGPALDQVRLRARRGPPGALAGRAPPGLVARACTRRRWRQACAGSAPTTWTSTSCTTRAWTRSSATTCSRSWSACKDEGKLRHYGVALGPAIGWRDEGLRALAEHDITSRPDGLQRARAGPRARLPRGRGAQGRGACWRASRPRAGCWRTSTRSRRPSRSTTTAATAHASGSSRGCRRSSACASCARSTGSRWRRRALRFVLAQHAIACVLPDRRRMLEDLEEWAGALGRARPHRRGPRAHRRALRAQLRRRARRGGASGATGATGRAPGTSRAPRCPSPAGRSRCRSAWTASRPTASPWRCRSRCEPDPCWRTRLGRARLGGAGLGRRRSARAAVSPPPTRDQEEAGDGDHADADVGRRAR